MSSPVILIRADASVRTGTGHVMRCLALAQAWSEAGGRPVILQASGTAALSERIAREGIERRTHDAAAGSAEDAVLTAEAARRLGAEWVVADGYAFDSRWQRRVREAGLRLLLIDDFGHADAYDTDVVLNQNASARASLYPSRGAATRLLLGTRYALLRREFRDPLPPQPGTAGRLRLLVTMGGSDADDATGMVVDSLATLPGLDVTVVAGGSNPHLAGLRRRIESTGPTFRLIVDSSEMPLLMSRADAAISASGSTVWELARAAVPTALLVTAENQTGIAAALAAAGAALRLGRHPGLTADELRPALSAWLADPQGRAAMAARASQLVDGHGARRVCAALRSSLRITLLSDADSWLGPWVAELAETFSRAGHSVRRLHRTAELGDGDIAFFLSLSRIVPRDLLRCHAHNLVVHESALPHGRGWSPLTWQVLEGRNEIPVTLFEAGDGVDDGAIYAQRVIPLRGDELIDELRAAQAAATCELCQDFVARYPFVCAEGVPQSGTPTFYPRRRPADSRLDPHRTIADQFNLLRVCDPERYPAYFEHAGRRFAVHVTALP
jgi:UDP-2,4-diacetamido-2,4,6-trideoxy-beta-L-altropyranose hydrolase